jgi:hypothetical protein
MFGELGAEGRSHENIYVSFRFSLVDTRGKLSLHVAGLEKVGSRTYDIKQNGTVVFHHLQKARLKGQVSKLCVANQAERFDSPHCGHASSEGSASFIQTMMLAGAESTTTCISNLIISGSFSMQHRAMQSHQSPFMIPIFSRGEHSRLRGLMMSRVSALHIIFNFSLQHL